MLTVSFGRLWALGTAQISSMWSEFLDVQCGYLIFRQLQSYLQYKVTIYQINIIILCKLLGSIHKSNAWRLYGPGKVWWWEWMKMRMNMNTYHVISYILHTNFKYQHLQYMSITDINRKLILNLWTKKVWQIDKIGWIYLLPV